MVEKPHKDEKPYLIKLAALGFSNAESAIYVYLIERGSEAGVSKIAAGARMHRQQVYLTLPSLIDRGVIEKVEGRVAKYRAKPPASLERVARRQMGVAEDLSQELERISRVGYEQEFESIVGVKAFQQYELERARKMREGEEQFIIGTERDEYLEVMGSFYAEAYVPILAKKKIVTYYLAPENQAKRRSEVDKRQLFHVRVLPKLSTGPLATLIQGDSLIFYVNVHPATIYVIKSKKVAEGYRTFFHMLWDMAGQPESRD